jgi:hydroxymethylbilane synthase
MDTNRVFRIGSRTSILAIKQAQEALGYLREFYPDIKAEVIGIDTYGDIDKATPISDIEGTDFFTREIDDALFRGEIDPSTSSLDFTRDDPELAEGSLRANGERSRTIDFAVHSAKDLPDKIRQGLYIAAITKSIDPYDALVSRNNLKMEQLPLGAKIGASSSRRKEQLKKYRADFEIIDVRGTIEERLKKLDELGLEGIIVASCALVRLGLEKRIAQRIPFEILKPHPLQGSLAIEIREDDFELKTFLNPISKVF